MSLYVSSLGRRLRSLAWRQVGLQLHLVNDGVATWAIFRGVLADLLVRLLLWALLVRSMVDFCSNAACNC